MAYKARSITSKASSACKMNMGLVQGAADIGASKAFKDHSEGMAEKFSGGGGSAPQGKPDSDDKNDDKTEDEKGGQADAAITTDSTETPEV